MTLFLLNEVKSRTDLVSSPVNISFRFVIQDLFDLLHGLHGLFPFHSGKENLCSKWSVVRYIHKQLTYMQS